jgi:hypothetical protein
MFLSSAATGISGAGAHAEAAAAGGRSAVG